MVLPVDTGLCDRCPHETKLYSKFYILFQILSRPDNHYVHHPRYLHPGSRDFSFLYFQEKLCTRTPRTVQDGEGNGALPGSGVPELFRLMPGEPGMPPRTIHGTRGYPRSCTVPGTAVPPSLARSSPGPVGNGDDDLRGRREPSFRVLLTGQVPGDVQFHGARYGPLKEFPRTDIYPEDRERCLV